MTYKDDLDKLRKEAGIDVDHFDPSSDEPASAKSSSKYIPLSSNTSEKAPSPRETEPFTQEEKKLTWWQKIHYILNSYFDFYQF